MRVCVPVHVWAQLCFADMLFFRIAHVHCIIYTKVQWNIKTHMIMFSVISCSEKKLQSAECMGKKSPAFDRLLDNLYNNYAVLVNRALSFG
jgi:hypothetical protein